MLRSAQPSQFSTYTYPIQNIDIAGLAVQNLAHERAIRSYHDNRWLLINLTRNDISKLPQPQPKEYR